MEAAPENVAHRLASLGLAATEDFGRALAFAVDAQLHRTRNDPDMSSRVTRTTALIGAAWADLEVQELGMKAGIVWDRLAEDANLSGWSPNPDPRPLTDAAVHNRVLDSLDLYAEQYSDRDVIDALGLALSLVETGKGLFLDRIEEAGGSIVELVALWSEVLTDRASRDFGAAETLDVSPPVQQRVRVWVTTGKPDTPQPVDLEDLSVGAEMPWMVPAGVREADYVLLWVAGGTGFRYVTRALTDASFQSIRGRTAPATELRVEHVLGKPIPFGALTDDPILGSWSLVRRKMQGAVRAQSTALSDDPNLWSAFVDLAVASNPELTSWVLEVGAPSGEDRTRIDWISDAAATVDQLRRRPLAEDLARRLDRIARVVSPDEGANTSFLVHIDGPWGSGKSTLLNFTREELTDRGWLVVDFNAWRQSDVGPPWWTLFSALRRTHRGAVSRWHRMKLTLREMWQRIEVAGSPTALAAIAIAVAVLLAYWMVNPSWRWETVTDVAAVTGAIVSMGGALIAGTRIARRYLLWDTAGGAERLDEVHADPMVAIRRHFNWYLRSVGRPVAYLIDDLDRCDTEYVVDLLEAIQTLIRDSHEMDPTNQDRRLVKGPYFVVAADGRWIRSSFDAKFGIFSDYVGEPGRPLGYLFLDKIFQLTLQVPSLSPSWQDEYLRELLRVGAEADLDVLDEEERLRSQLEAAENDDEVFAATDRASPMVQARVASTVLAKLSEPEVEKQRRHALSKFARLMDRNPRSMKRFVNTYSVLQGVRFLEHARVPRDVLALWSIVQTRWPLLAAYLRTEPDSVILLRDGQVPADLPETLKELVTNGDIADVLTFPAGGPMTPVKIRQCCGMDSD